MQGLPASAATWREDNWPIDTELAALSVERLDALIALRTSDPKKQVMVPKRAEILRPGQQPEQKKMTTDPREIAAFFRAHSAPKR